MKRSRWISPERGKLKTKLLCVYFLLLVLPLGLFTIYAYSRIRGTAREQTLSAAQNAFDSSAASVQQALDTLDEVLDILAADPLVYAMASNDPADFSYIKRLEDSDQLELTFQHLRKLSGVAQIRLYVDNGYLYTSGRSSIMQAGEAAGSGWYEAVTGGGGRSWFAPADLSDQPEAERQRFAAMRVIYNPRAVLEPLAILRADTDAAYILQYLNAPPVVENGTLMLLRGDQVLCASEGGRAAEEWVDLAGRLPASGGGWEPVEWEGRRYYAQCRDLEGMDWRMASVLPAAGVFRLSTELRLEMLAVVVALGVAAYTFVRYHNLPGSVPAVGLRSPADKVTRIVKEVAGEEITYDGRPILASYGAMNAGQSASSRSVWGTALPYLTPVESEGDPGESGFQQTKTIPASEVKSKLEKAFSVNLDGMGEDEWFDILSYWDDGPYVNEVRIAHAVTTTGRKLRESVFSLRSTAFEVRYDPGAESFDFITQGYGHGVGMSQVGAKYYANQGWDHVEILEHYYPGAIVTGQ